MSAASSTAPPRIRRVLLVLSIAVAVVGLALAVRGGIRLYQRLTRPPPRPRQVDVQLIAGWMTVPYIARTFGVPGNEIFAALGVSPQENRNRSLNEIADAQGRSRDEVVAVAQQTVARLQAMPAPKQNAPPPNNRGPPSSAGTGGP